MSPPPDNVVDKGLYSRIKANIHARLERQGKAWGAYSSKELVAKYKKAGGRYSGSASVAKSKSKLTRWFREKWKDEKGNDCGSKKNLNTKKCRPTIRIDKNTPITWGELSKKEKERAIRAKKKVGMGQRAPSIKKKSRHNTSGGKIMIPAEAIYINIDCF